MEFKKLLKRSIATLTLACMLTTSSETVIPAINSTTIIVNAATYSKDTIKAVQNKLNDLGYECGKADGVAGKKTKAAIENYQEAKDLDVTGTINKTLLKSLGISTSTKSTSNSSSSKGSSDKSITNNNSTTDTTTDKQSVTVYVTDTGSKYHSSGCKYLKKSKHAISLEDAKNRNYEPCSVCKP